jgi:hypothetical protein
MRYAAMGGEAYLHLLISAHSRYSYNLCLNKNISFTDPAGSLNRYECIEKLLELSYAFYMEITLMGGQGLASCTDG